MTTCCNRCGEPVDYQPEVCWLCFGPLCSECWEQLGHCGHPRADAANRVMRLLPDEASRAHFVRTILKGHS